MSDSPWDQLLSGRRDSPSVIIIVIIWIRSSTRLMLRPRLMTYEFDRTCSIANVPDADPTARRAVELGCVTPRCATATLRRSVQAVPIIIRDCRTVADIRATVDLRQLIINCRTVANAMVPRVSVIFTRKFRRRRDRSAARRLTESRGQIAGRGATHPCQPRRICAVRAATVLAYLVWWPCRRCRKRRAQKLALRGGPPTHPRSADRHASFPSG